MSEPRPVWLNPIKRWQRLPISLKLLLPVLTAFAIILTAFFVFISPALNSFIQDNVRLGFNTQLDQVSARVQAFLTDSQRHIVGITESFEARQYASFLDNPGTVMYEFNQRALTSLMVASMSASEIRFADLRFLSADGKQLIRVQARSAQSGLPGVVVPADLLESEAGRDTAEAVRKLRAGDFYISSPLMRQSPGQAGGAPELAFEVGAPVYEGGKLAGMVVGDIRPRDYLLAAFRPSQFELFNFTTMLLDEAQQPILIIERQAMPPVRVLGDAQLRAPALPPQVFAAPDRDVMNVEDRTYSVLSLSRLAAEGVPNTGWRLVVSKLINDLPITSAGEVVNAAITRTALLFVALLAFLAVIGQSLVRPLYRVSQEARRIAEGDLSTRISVTSQDEIGQLAGVLNDLSERMGETLTTLESRVAERTRNIAIAAQIGHEAAQTRSISELLQRAVDTIREQFGFYHAQVFLMDDVGQYAVLFTSTGEAGKVLLSRQHKLAVGSASIVGQVAEKRRTFITLDTQQSEVPHRFNPVLPLTRSEMALPLQVGDKLIGVLDVQSVEPNAFDEEDVQIFQLLADQLAIAIDNARLLAEQEQRLRQIEDLNRQLTRSAWNEYVEEEKGQVLTYRYDLMSIQALPPGDKPNGDTPGRKVNAPITVRGEPVGDLSVVEGQDLPLTADDRAIIQAVADRVALAVENIRLVQQTQSALTRVEQLYQSSRALGSASQIEEVYEIAAQRLGAFEFVDQVIIALARPKPSIDAPYLEFVYVWSRAADAPARSITRPLREIIPPHWTQETRTPQIVDMERATPYRGETRALFELMGMLDARSMIVAPIATPGRWFGVAACQSSRANAFNQSYAQFLSAVADQAAIALENRLLFAETQAEAQRNRALAEAAQVTSQIGLDFEIGVANLVRTVALSANFDRWWFGQVNLAARGVVLERVTAFFPTGSPLHAMHTVNLETDQNPIAEVTRIGEALTINAPANHNILRKLPPKIGQAYGKHMVVPVRTGNNIVGILMLGRALTQPDIDERDEQLGITLSNQIAVALENRRLFNVAQSERETLQSILNSLPTGVVVVDAATGLPSLANDTARALLGMNELEPYMLVHTTTNEPYTEDELPTVRVLRTQEPIYAEDLTVIDTFGNRTDLLVNAVPIIRDGQLLSAVAVYQDVTELRELENVLQESLRETTTLYEISRAISAENDLNSILNVLARQIYMLFAPDHLFAIFINADGGFAPILKMQQIDETLVEMVEIDDCPVPADVLLTDETFVNSDITENPDLANDPLLRALGIVSLSVLPLRARSHLIGWLVVGFGRVKIFAPEERRTLSNMADQTAVAAESARLADQTAQALNTTTLLYEASLNIYRADTIEDTLSAMRDQLRFFAPTYVDIFSITMRRGERVAEWVVDYDAENPDLESSVRVFDAPTFDYWPLMEAPPDFISDVSVLKGDDLELFSHAPNWGRVRALASVPLLVKGRLTGRIIIGFEERHRFTLNEQQVITTVADQGAVAIDSFALMQQTQESLDETAVLYQTSRAIANALDPREELQAIIDFAVQPIVSGALLVRLLSPSWHTPDASLQVVASWSRDPETAVDLTGIRFTPDQFPAWRELSTDVPLWIEDLDAYAASAEGPVDHTVYQILGFKSIIVFPLTSLGQPIGALMFGAQECWPRTERELRIYSSLTDLIAISMEKKRLLEQTERRARQLQLSAQIAQSAISTLDLSELFDRTVNLIKESFAYDHVQVFLIDSEGRDARVVASTGEAGRRLLAIGHKLAVGSRSVIGQVTETGIPQIVSDITDRRSIHKPNPYLPRTRAEMALPLKARNRILGALDVQSNEPGAFTRDDVAVLSSLADQIAIAIDNAELFATANRRAEEMRFLFTATRAAAAALNEEQVDLSNVARLVCENLDAESATLMLLDDSRTRLIPHSAAMPGVDITVPPYYEFNTPFFSALAAGKEPMVVNDVPAVLQLVSTSSRLGQSRLLQQFQGLLPNAGSMVLVPLMAGENLVGILGAAKQERNGFNDDALRLLQTLGSTLSASIQNARLLHEVQAANIRLLELDRVKNQFLANMSHELRTPLNSIIGFSRVMLKGIDGPLTEMQEQDLSTIYESGRHLLGLVNDILDQAKIEADKMEFSVSQFSVIDLVKGVASTAVGLLKDKPVRLHQEIEPDLPLVWGDEFRTRQALLNLVSNAAKFTHQGSITLSAFRIEENNQPFVQVSVTDTGIGIPRDKLEAIFEPFHQVENSAARQYEGTGLGLPIAKKLIDKQGGRMWVESEPGVGSTFSFTMPVNRVEVAEEAEQTTDGEQA